MPLQPHTATTARAPRPAKRAPRQLFSEQAYRLIKQRIITSEYPGGYHALEEDLARDLGISRTPLKEALLTLQSEGLVRLIPRRGMVVNPLTAADITEIYRLLEALEDLAVGLICERSDAQDDLQALQVAVDEMQEALRRDDLDAWAVADDRFHWMLVTASGNARLAHAAQTLLNQSQRFRLFTLRLRDRPVKSTKNHADLVKVLRRGDAAKARALHAAQKVGWREHLAALLEKYRIRQI